MSTLTSKQVIPIPPEISSANMRTSLDFQSAKRHSSLVSLLKFALPLLTIALVVLFAGSTFISYTPQSDTSVEEVGLKGGKLVMTNPKMTGFDKNKRPYNVTALKAIQDLTKPGIIELETIDAKLPVDANSFARVNANDGTYNSTDDKMVLRNNVKINGARGMDISLEDAHIDMKTGSMVSDKPVTVISKDTNISADSLKVEDNGKRIVFKKNVKMIITRPVSRGVKPPATN